MANAAWRAMPRSSLKAMHSTSDPRATRRSHIPVDSLRWGPGEPFTPTRRVTASCDARGRLELGRGSRNRRACAWHESILCRSKVEDLPSNPEGGVHVGGRPGGWPRVKLRFKLVEQCASFPQKIGIVQVEEHKTRFRDPSNGIPRMRHQDAYGVVDTLQRIGGV